MPQALSFFEPVTFVGGLGSCLCLKMSLLVSSPIPFLDLNVGHLSLTPALSGNAHSFSNPLFFQCSCGAATLGTVENTMLKSLNIKKQLFVKMPPRN